MILNLEKVGILYNKPAFENLFSARNKFCRRKYY